MTMEMGCAKRPINPAPDVPHQNWGAQTHTRAEGLEADLYTRVCVIRQQGAAGIVVDVDAIQLSVEQADALRGQVASAIGTEAAHVRFSYTHSHATPSVWGNLPDVGRRASGQYWDTVIAETVQAALEAAANMEGVSVYAGDGRCAIAQNRRQPFEGRTIVGYNPAGDTSDRVLVVRCETDDGRVKAHFVHYACHPTTLGFTNRLYSPDYPGMAKRFMDDTFGGICLFLQGCAGDQGPGPNGFFDRVAAMRRLGLRLGMAAGVVSAELATQGETPVFRGVQESGATLGLWDMRRERNAGRFAVRSESCPLPLKPVADPDVLEREYADLSGRLEQLRRDGAADEEVRGMLYRSKRGFLALQMSKAYFGKSHFPVELHYTVLHDTVLVGMPLEPFIGLQKRLQSQFPRLRIGLSGYTNGWLGYLAERGDYAVGGYELDTSPFSQDAADVLLHAIRSGIAELTGQGPLQQV